MNERITKLARQAGFNDFSDDKNGIWITDGYWNEQLERFYEMAFETGRVQGFKQDKALTELAKIEQEIERGVIRINERTRELSKQVGLWPAVTDIFPIEIERLVELVRQDEREACAKLCEEQDEYGCGQYAKAIRARGRTHEGGKQKNNS